MEHIIDATGKSLGRVATDAAVFLMGKHNPSFTRNALPKDRVTIAHAGKIQMTEKKKRTTKHTRYSGYPGGLTIESNALIVGKKGMSELVRLAVKGMLPKNKLQPLMMKNLTITE